MTLRDLRPDASHPETTGDEGQLGPLDTVYTYDLLGRTNQIALKSNDNSYPETSTMDRIQETLQYFEQTSGDWFNVTRVQTYLTDNDATPTVLLLRKERLTNLGSNVAFKVTETDVHGNLTVTTVTIDRATKLTTTTVVPPDSSLYAVTTEFNGLLVSESTPTVSKATRYFYDSFGRLTQIKNPNDAFSYMSYNANGQVETQTDFTGQTTTFQYYGPSEFNAGRLKVRTEANNKKTYFAYDGRGQVTRIWGDVPYPEERIYDEYGQLKNLITYRGGSGWNNPDWNAITKGTPDTTTWNYQDSTGLLLAKVDQLGRAVTYGYYTNNLLKTRTWSRGDSVTYTYSDLGDLIGMDYTDVSPGSVTPDVTYANFNRAGQPRQLTDGIDTRTLAYDYAGRLETDVCNSGEFAGITLVNHYDSLYGRNQFKVQGTTPQVQHDFGFDPATGRLNSVAAGSGSVTYGYWPDSDLVQQSSFRYGGSEQLLTSRVWEYGTRLQSIANTAWGLSVSAHAYQYDWVNRRWRASLADGSRWDYGYDDRNEVTSGKRYWSDGSAVAGQHFEYNYDSIGNRTWARSGGDVNGANLRQTDYTPIELNQYSAISTPGYQPISGVAAAASVTVNGQVLPAEEMHHREITLANGRGRFGKRSRSARAAKTKPRSCCSRRRRRMPVPPIRSVMISMAICRATGCGITSGMQRTGCSR